MSFTHPLGTDRLATPFERVGRAVMDLGFGGFLEKFEQHFGAGITKALLILIGLTVASLCGSVIWTYLLLPIAQLLPDPKSGPAYQFAKLTLIVALFLMMVNQLLDLANNYLKRKLRTRLREKVERAERLMVELNEARAEAEALHSQLVDCSAAARLVLEEAINTAVGRELITVEQADELRELAKTPASDDPPDSA